MLGLARLDAVILHYILERLRDATSTPPRAPASGSTATTAAWTARRRSTYSARASSSECSPPSGVSTQGRCRRSRQDSTWWQVRVHL